MQPLSGGKHVLGPFRQTSSVKEDRGISLNQFRTVGSLPDTKSGGRCDHNVDPPLKDERHADFPSPIPLLDAKDDRHADLVSLFHTPDQKDERYADLPSAPPSPSQIRQT